MQVLRTPEERFHGLKDYPFDPHYVEIPATPGSDERIRMHYLDEGPPEADEVVLCLHGEPSWSYLYRKMIPMFSAVGLRTIVPDLIGFGKSDKPSSQADYTYQRHVDWVRAALDAIELAPATLVCQDWGGLIGLRLLGEEPERFARCVAANTFLPTGDAPPNAAFAAWKEFSQTAPEFPVGGIVNSGCTTDLDADVIAAYDAPFPDDRFTAGARIFPALVPDTPDNPASAANRAAWEGLSRFHGPFLCAFSDADPITAGAWKGLVARIPGAAGRKHPTIEGGGHFLQEDRGPELAKIVVEFINSTVPRRRES